MDAASHIVVFYFADKIVYSANSISHLGIKYISLLPHQIYQSLLHVLLLHSGGVLCSYCDAFIPFSP